MRSYNGGIKVGEFMENIVPREKWLYNDRGMMNWMGWILADHSAYLESEQKHQQINPVKPEMTIAEINRLLQSNWQQRMAITIQLNVIRQDWYAPAVTGTVVGFNDECTYLQLTDGALKAVKVQTIRNVSLADRTKWWLYDDSI